MEESQFIAGGEPGFDGFHVRRRKQVDRSHQLESQFEPRWLEGMGGTEVVLLESFAVDDAECLGQVRKPAQNRKRSLDFAFVMRLGHGFH